MNIIRCQTLEYVGHAVLRTASGCSQQEQQDAEMARMPLGFNSFASSSRTSGHISSSLAPGWHAVAAATSRIASLYRRNRRWAASSFHRGWQVITMTCAVCGSSVQVRVPLSAQPGTAIRAACPRCTAENDFALPSSSGMGFPGFSAGDPGLGDPGNDELLYVACEMGERAVEMMVDTGAQSSVATLEPSLKGLQVEPRRGR